MYPISNEVKTLFESEQKQILRITGGEKSPISNSVGPSAIASFSDAIAADALNLSVDITPVQPGSGDPSPTNVRPISGWTGANVVVSPTTDAQDGTTYPISWQSEAGTVYGGTLDVTTGLLTVTMAEVDLGTLEWQYISDDVFFTSGLYGVKKPGINNYINSTYGFSALSFANMPDKTMKGNVNAGGMYVKDSAFEQNPATAKTGLSGVQLVYELATPQTYQLSPTEVALLLGDNNVWADCGDVTVEYATGYKYEISITDANVMMDGFNIDRFSCNGNKLEIGTACSSELTLKLDNRQGQYSGIVFEGAELFVEVGIGSPVNWIPCGYFTPDEQPRSLSTITIKALDRMTRFDAVPPTLTPWTTQSGEVITTANGEPIYFVSNVRFPITVANLVKRVALLCNVPFTQSLTTFPNYNYTIQALPTLQQDITFRNIIQWCAGIMGANAWIDWTGSLRFSWYGATTGYTTTTANRFSSDLFEDDITLTGVTYTNTQGVSIVSGTPEYALDMTGNYMAASGISTILPNIKNRINGFTYRPFTASVINAPYLWPMDMITFNKDGVNHTCAVTNVNFGINGTTELAGKGETAQTNSGVAPSGMTTEQGYLIEKAAENVRQLDESLDQESIFNRLTDNGETQGLILYDGKVYLNASYIQTGTMVADFIKGGALTLGGLNNTNGVLQILDASGNVIGTWNKDGITLNKGTINGTSITLGGNNNASGTLTIKNASGTTIGTWDKDGINATTGTFSGALNGATGTFSGEMSASGIKGGTLTLGGNNNVNGVMQVLDASGNVIGTWNKDGIILNKGSINLNNGVFEVTANGALTANSATINGILNTTGTDYWSKPISMYVGRGSIRFHMPNDHPIRDAYAYINAYSLDYTSEYDINAYKGKLRIIGNYGIYIGGDGQPGYPENLTIGLGGNKIETQGDLTLYNAGNLNVNTGNGRIGGNLTVIGTKSREVTTDQYSDRLLYCYETPTPMFGDIGEGKIGEDGLCYISLDAVFAQTVVTQQYQVFLQRYGEGECWLRERKSGYFIVQGTPGLAFGWEIKAKQRDYDQLRLERADEPFTVPEQSYGADAAQYIEDIRKERISA